MEKDSIPKFSVAMSIYKNDSPSYLCAALDSICSQSYPPDEIFLVVDGPIGNELEAVITDYTNKYSNFTIFRHETNQGLGIALKHAVEKCRNELIIRMDSDDISAPGRFKKQIDSYIDEPVDVLGGWTLGFFGSLSEGDISAFRPALSDSEIKRKFIESSQISHVTALLRRSAVLKAGNYQDLYYHEDYYLWTRMINSGCTFKNIPEYLVYVRCGEDQAARHGGRKYYNAEKKLRNYMLDHHLCSKAQYFKQIAIRFVYQVLLTPSIRVIIDKKIKRTYITREEADLIINRES